MNIHWQYQGDAGFWDSYEGRFSICPVFIGRTTPQGYELHDALKTHPRRTFVGGQATHESHVYPGMSTVAEAKAKAEQILNLKKD